MANQMSVECYKCKDCEDIFFAPKVACPKCGSVGVEKVASEGKGKIVDFTTVFFPPDNYKGREPYTSTLVQLDNGCKLFGIMEGVPNNINPGSRVMVSARDESTGGFVFKLA